MNADDLIKKSIRSMSEAEKEILRDALHRLEKRKVKKARKRQAKQQWDYTIRDVKHTYTCKLCSSEEIIEHKVHTCSKIEEPCIPRALNFMVKTCPQCADTVMGICYNTQTTRKYKEERINSMLQRATEVN